ILHPRLQMRHDFLRANLQVLHLIEHRIENDMLRAGADDLLNLLRALRAAAPDRDAWPEGRILVALAEPLAYAFLAACPVVIDGEIHPFAVTESRGIASCLVQKTPNLRRLADERVGRRRTRAHPTVALFHGAVQSVLVINA